MPELRIGRLKGRWVVTWHDETGRRRRYRLDAATKADAEREALDAYRRHSFTPSATTIADLWTAYRTEKEGRRVAAAMQSEWQAIGPSFGHLRPDQIEIRHSREHIAKRRKAGIRDGTIWTELGHLRTVLRWAQARQMIQHAPPIERPAKPAPKDRWLTHEEIRRLLDTPMAPHIRLAILLMLGTAARPTAALELTWSRVDLDRGVIDLRVTDDGPRKGRAIVPMNKGLRCALLEARKVALSDHVIEWCGEPVRSIKTGLHRALAAAKLEGVTPHTFRHTAAVHMAAGGRPMERIAQYLGHSSTVVTERVYARFAPDHLRDEAALLDFASPRAVGSKVQ